MEASESMESFEWEKAGLYFIGTVHERTMACFGNLFISGNPSGYKMNFKSFAKNYSARKNAVIKKKSAISIGRNFSAVIFIRIFLEYPPLAMYQILKDLRGIVI